MITPRLQGIIDYISKPTVADIGTDHAYIPIHLVRNNICTKVIATDIRKGPVEAARRHIKKYNQNIEVRLGGGLDPVCSGEAEQIIIAGMGGEMICKIISENFEKARAAQLVLQPMNAQYELRRFLHENGFSIQSESLAKEGVKIYNIMLAANGHQEPFSDDFDYHIPPYLADNELIQMLIYKKKREFIKILTGNQASQNPDSEIIAYYKRCLAKLEQINDIKEQP